MNSENYPSNILKWRGWPLLIHVLVCTILFSIYCIWFRTPLIADDNRYLWLSTQKEFDFTWMGPPAARSPLHGLLFFVLLKLDFLRSTFYFFTIVLFSIHAASVYLIASKISGFFKPGENNRAKSLLVLVGSIVFTFHPNFLEVMFMAMSSIVVIGGLFMALTLYSGRFIPLFVFGFVSFSFYETYILPTFLLQLVPFLDHSFSKIKFKDIFNRLMPLLLAFGFYFFLRYYLGKELGSYNQMITIDLLQNFNRVLHYFFAVFTFGYPGDFSSRVEISVFLVILIVLYKKTQFHVIRKILLLLVIGFLSCSIDLLVPYDGIRVIYGSYFFKVSANLLLMYTFLQIFPGRYFLLGMFILSPIYLVNLFSMYKIRLHNYNNEKNIERFVSGMYNIAEPGKTMLLPPTNSVHFDEKDWQLEPNSTMQFKLFRSLQSKQKDFNYRIVGFDSLRFLTEDFPLIYPSRAFVYNHSGAWIEDDISKTGLVFHVKEGNYGDAVFGPYMPLDSGKYKVEYYFRVKNECSENAEFGDFHVKSSKGQKVIASSKLFSNDFNVYSYPRKTIEFYLEKPESDIEFVVFSNGLLDFYIDYIRVTRL